MKILMILFLLASCSDNKFSRVEELTNFRILGIIASAPEVAPGGNSNLQLVVSDPTGAGRSIIGQTKSCIDPGIALGASVSCDHDPSTVTGTYTIDFTNDADLGSADLYTGVATQNLNVTVPATIFAARSARDQSNGVGHITIFNFIVDGKAISAFKRISASNRGSLNSNPTIASVLLNDVAIVSKPAKDDKLKVTTGALETYNFINIDGSVELKTEEVAAAWYVSYGELNKPKSEVGEEVKYLSSPPGSTMIILTLVRDDRGGLTIQKNVLP